MFKKIDEIDDAFETSFVSSANMGGANVEVTIERRKRRFLVNGRQAWMSERKGEIVFNSGGQEYAIEDTDWAKRKLLHRGWHLPIHRICRDNCEFPTVRVAKLGEGDKKRSFVCVQWFGIEQDSLMPEVCIPEGSQFLFTLNGGMGPDEEIFNGNSESFRVVFLGQAKDWLSKKTTKAMIDGPGRGNPDSWFVWALSSEVLTNHGPSSPLLMPDLLGDPNCGVIVPKFFGDLRIRDEVMKNF